MYFESARQLVIARERNRGQVRMTVSMDITEHLTDFSESARKSTRARIQEHILNKKTKIENRATNS